MTDRGDRSWQMAFQHGKRALQHHNNKQALRLFEEALSSCPVNHKKELAEILYLLGTTLNKLGMRNCALKSWIASGRLEKNGYAVRWVRRYANAYGMAKQEDTREDDWKAFYSIQLYRYLCSKTSRKIGTDAERDMIEDLILDAWNELTQTYRFDLLSPEEKVSLFRNTRIVFPSYSVPDEDYAGETIPVDFHRKQRLNPNDHCYCGSGLPFKACCGRLPGKNELLSGIL